MKDLGQAFIGGALVMLALILFGAVLWKLDKRMTPAPNPECACPCMTPGDELRVDGFEPRVKPPSPYNKNG